MRSMRPLLALLAVLAATLASACGGERAATSTTASAELAPRDAAVWATVDTDPESTEWQALASLLARVPGAADALEGLLAESLEDEGLSWEEDVLPALGPELVLVVPGGVAGGVALTRPDDKEKLRALAARGEGAVLGERDGWTVVAESQAALDAYERALEDGTLAGDPDFQEATSGLPDEALAYLYLDGAGLDDAVARGAAQAGSAVPGAAVPGTSLPGVGLAGPLSGSTASLGTAAAAVTAEEDGLRLVALAEPGTGLPDRFTPTLLERVPADALAAVAFKGGETVRSQLDRAAGGPELRRQLENGLGVSLEELAELLAGEGVLYVRAGAPIPEVTLALDGAGRRGVALLGGLVEGLGGLFSLGGAPALEPQTSTEDGVEVTRLELDEGVAIRWAAVGETLLVTTGAGGIRAFRGDGAKLTGTDAFARAAEDVGYEGETNGFAFADVDRLVPLLEGLAEQSGDAGDEPFADVAAALEALDTVALDARAEDGWLRIEGFLRVR